MKKLSRDEMKKLKGGDDDGPPKCGSSGCTPGPYDTCPSSCPCTNGNLNWKCTTPPKIPT